MSSSTICVSDFVGACDRADKYNSGPHEEPINDRDVNLAHELSGSVHDFEPRKATNG